MNHHLLHQTSCTSTRAAPEETTICTNRSYARPCCPQFAVTYILITAMCSHSLMRRSVIQCKEEKKIRAMMHVNGNFEGLLGLLWLISLH